MTNRYPLLILPDDIGERAPLDPSQAKACRRILPSEIAVDWTDLVCLSPADESADVDGAWAEDIGSICSGLADAIVHHGLGPRGSWPTSALDVVSLKPGASPDLARECLDAIRDEAGAKAWADQFLAVDAWVCEESEAPEGEQPSGTCEDPALREVLRDAAALLARVRGLVLSPTTASEIDAVIERCNSAVLGLAQRRGEPPKSKSEARDRLLQLANDAKQAVYFGSVELPEFPSDETFIRAASCYVAIEAIRERGSLPDDLRGSTSVAIIATTCVPPAAGDSDWEKFIATPLCDPAGFMRDTVNANRSAVGLEPQPDPAPAKDTEEIMETVRQVLRDAGLSSKHADNLAVRVLACEVARLESVLKAAGAEQRKESDLVLTLREMPSCSPEDRVSTMAREAKLFGEAANGYSLPDHLLTRAAMALDVVLRSDDHRYRPSVACILNLIAAQFDQSTDGESPKRNAKVWQPIDTSRRFPGLPSPWDRTFGLVAPHDTDVFRGGVEGERFLASNHMAVRVSEEVYQAAEYVAERLPEGATWARVLPEELGPLTPLQGGARGRSYSYDCVAVGSAWLKVGYYNALVELGVTEVLVGQDARCVVAPGVAMVMGLAGVDPVVIARPAVGERYVVSGLIAALVEITYVSDERMLARCLARKPSTAWVADGTEAEWVFEPDRWRRANEEHISRVEADIGNPLPPPVVDSGRALFHIERIAGLTAVPRREGEDSVEWIERAVLQIIGEHEVLVGRIETGALVEPDQDLLRRLTSVEHERDELAIALRDIGKMAFMREAEDAGELQQQVLDAVREGGRYRAEVVRMSLEAQGIILRGEDRSLDDYRKVLVMAGLSPDKPPTQAVLDLLMRIKGLEKSAAIAVEGGADLIAAERLRQLEKWTPEHDSEHKGGEIAIRAAELAVSHTDAGVRHPDLEGDAWGLVRKHAHDPVRALTVAGALIAAEIDRLLARADGSERCARGTAATRPEPDPIPNDSPAIWDLVIQDLLADFTGVEQLVADAHARDAHGRKHYGTPLQAFNGRKPWVDAYQEALDRVVYLRQAIAEGHESLRGLYITALVQLVHLAEWRRARPELEQ